MDDQELLTYAAKAAKIFVTPETWPYKSPIDFKYLETSYDSDSNSITGIVLCFSFDNELSGTTSENWNPLNDDADAFQLAFKLKMELITNQKNKLNEAQRQCRARIKVGDGIRNFYEILDENMQDASPLRRAIVRAAAEIGRGM